MAQFELTTFINAAPALVFDLSRSIDLHIISTGKTRERAVAGVMKGLIGMGETVTWEAEHLFKTRSFTSVITAFDFPNSFTDEMSSGDLKTFCHQHLFKKQGGGTVMTDSVKLTAPYGALGKLVMTLFLKKYFINLMTERNMIIKEYAENGKGEMILKQHQD